MNAIIDVNDLLRRWETLVQVCVDRREKGCETADREVLIVRRRDRVDGRRRSTVRRC